MEAIFWLGVVILLVVFEIITLGLTTIWFAGKSWWVYRSFVSCQSIGAGASVFRCFCFAFDIYQTDGDAVYEQEPDKDQCGKTGGEGSSGI